MSRDREKRGSLLAAHFPKGVLLLGACFALFFAAELVFEWVRLGRPTPEQMSWAGVNNTKLVDSLSPIARAYNNVLAMLLATVGLAIPLTANMHTPKLIEIFLRDRINQVMLVAMALGAANTLWVLYIVGPEFAPVWAFRIAVYGALVGWVVLIPYFFYVMRFLDPSTIIARLRSDAESAIREGTAPGHDAEALQDEIEERLFQIGTLVIKSIDRADRSVAQEGVWSLKRILDFYGDLKPKMLERWFFVDRKDFIGLSHYAIQQINEDRIWLEMLVLNQLLLAYQHAVAKAPDIISAISNVNRVVAMRACERGDEHVVSLSVRFFNSFLREALNRRQMRAAYDILYQYRRLTRDIAHEHDMVCRIARYFVTYARVAEQTGNAFVSDLAGYDLAHVIRGAYEANNPRAREVLDALLSLPNHRGRELHHARVRAKIIAAAYLAELGRDDEVEHVRNDLSNVPSETVAAAAEELLSVEEPI